jgi:DNA mismatch repair protein MutS
MSFNTDKQTLEDLNILGKPGTDSVYSLYNNTRTSGGSALLEKMFLYPLANVRIINNRSHILQFFSSVKIKFPFKTEHLDSAENYLGLTDERTRLSPDENSLSRKLSRLVAADGDYKLIHNGVIAIINILGQTNDFIQMIKPAAKETPYEADREELAALLLDPDMAILAAEKNTGKLSYDKIASLDKLIRFTCRTKMMQLLGSIYMLDVYITVAEAALKHQYAFPQALEPERYTMKLSGVYHPLVKNAIGNTIDITPESNVVFLTGANMAGKSTFMKSVGIALYLAHMGFPVAAEKMDFSIRDGIYTTINLPDDLASGNSHFYAEVLRLKKIAKELGADKNLFVIFDELFRGTNVKDAYEGTVAITEAFAGKRNCMFIVSTHIIEAGEVLKQRCSNINFVYLPTRVDKKIPVYTYKLMPGITADRHGMVIIENERILEIIRSRTIKTVQS